MNVPIKQSELIDEMWRDGLLLDSTYLRALVVDGVMPQEATTRLTRLKAERPQRANALS